MSRLLSNEDKLRFNFEEPVVALPKLITFANRNNSVTHRQPIPKVDGLTKRVITQKFPTIVVEETTTRKGSIRV